MKKTPVKRAYIAHRGRDGDENHHLWNNRGIWWCNVTVHKPDSTVERFRFSLRTRDIIKARTLRDKIFDDIRRHLQIAV